MKELITFTQPQGIHYFDDIITRSGHTGKKDSFDLPCVYFGQAFDHSGQLPASPYIKIGVAINPRRIRAYNQSGIDFKLWALWVAHSYDHAKQLEKSIHQDLAPRRVVLPNRANRELFAIAPQHIPNTVARALTHAHSVL